MVCYFLNFIAYQSNKKIIREKNRFNIRSLYTISKKIFKIQKLETSTKVDVQKCLLKLIYYIMNLRFCWIFFCFYLHY